MRFSGINHNEDAAAKSKNRLMCGIHLVSGTPRPVQNQRPDNVSNLNRKVSQTFYILFPKEYRLKAELKNLPRFFNGAAMDPD